MITVSIFEFGVATGIVLAVLVGATIVKALGQDRHEVVSRYSLVELVVIAASVYHQFVVVSPATGMENIIDGATWWIMGIVILKPWLSDLVDR